ncbi:alpha/beta hydrolase family protein [Tautonia sociabilis]|uniref:Alpha/beta fold hydrolase n=1 Tax=Tautonia sociabilis TaxID=2080755 RepID=A0A432MMU9_9BACT|nr:alpha/beta fold hydrolase [Tautonia sociabilis]RUL88774.1 alpha/beta fold hydrolase [Tautonia sociabilis]
MTPLLLAVSLLGPVLPIESAEDKPTIVGHWLGVLEVGPTKLTLVMHVGPGEGGSLEGSLDTPEQRAFGVPLETIALEGRSVRFEDPANNARFEGELAGDGETISGTFTQRGIVIPLTLSRAEAADLPRPMEIPGRLQGIWEGPIELPMGQTLRVALRVEPIAGWPGQRSAFFDSLDQGALGIPVSAISLEGERVRFEIKAIAGTFEGTLNEAGTTIEGTWSQSILKLPLTLEKVEKLTERARPQEPKPPFPYRVEELTFENPEAGITLAGTLTLPEGDGPFPAAVMVSGSGPQDRDETLLGHKPFLVIADHLTRAGIAVLRFDDRGVGESTGEFATATSEDFASDALAAVRTLRNRPEIDREAVGIIGHSEGGLVGPMVAARAPEEVGFLVLLAGTGVTGKEILLHQTELIVRASGLSESLIRVQVDSLRTLLSLIEEGRVDELSEDELHALMRDLTAGLEPEDREALENSNPPLAEATNLAVERLQAPWFQFFLEYDPKSALKRVRCPVLALFGEKDVQVDPAQNAKQIEDALASGGNDRVVVEVLPGLNHLFQHAETGSPLEYGAIEETFAPEALGRISSWIREATGRD